MTSGSRVWGFTTCGTVIYGGDLLGEHKNITQEKCCAGLG